MAGLWGTSSVTALRAGAQGVLCGGNWDTDGDFDLDTDGRC